MDVVAPEVRSRMMSGIRTRDTKPEITFRKALHRRGFRYRLHPRNVPGKPDFVLPRYRIAVFVHGCFWHYHDCSLFKMPSTRQSFWQAKLSRNRDRDAEVAAALRSTRWRRLTVWECSLRGPHRIGLEQALQLAETWFEAKSTCLEIRGSG